MGEISQTAHTVQNAGHPADKTDGEADTSLMTPPTWFGGQFS